MSDTEQTYITSGIFRFKRPEDTGYSYFAVSKYRVVSTCDKCKELYGCNISRVFKILKGIRFESGNLGR